MPDPMQNPDQPPPKPDGWELICLGILREEFGRRPSKALANVVRQLSKEEAAGPGWRLRGVAVLASLRRSLQLPLLRLPLAAAVALMGAFLFWHLWTVNFGPIRILPAHKDICSVSGEANVRWAFDSKHPAVGDKLSGGNLRLESGVLELTFNSEARVAVQGPAEIKLNGVNSMELQSGKMSAEVPPPAHGFSVKTPDATVVDLGTRFGLDSDADGTGRLDVFEGRVKLMPDSSGANTNGWLLTQKTAMTINAGGAAVANAYSETAYPQLSVRRTYHPANCGFDVTNMATIGGMPREFGFWSGPAYQITGPVQNIKPVEGAGMLRFLTPAAGRDSEVWQLMDLSSFKATLLRGDAIIKSTVLFNRVHGDARAAKKFVLTIAAFRGRPQNIEQLWAHRKELALCTAEREVTTDDDPATWERVWVTAPLPADADFLIVGIRAVAPPDAGASNPFPGDFADLIDCYIQAPLRASSTTR